MKYKIRHEYPQTVEVMRQYLEHIGLYPEAIATKNVQSPLLIWFCRATRLVA